MPAENDQLPLANPKPSAESASAEPTNRRTRRNAAAQSLNRPVRLRLAADGDVRIDRTELQNLREAIDRLHVPKTQDTPDGRLNAAQQGRFLDWLKPGIAAKQLDIDSRPVDARVVKAKLRAVARQIDRLKLLLSAFGDDREHYDSPEDYKAAALFQIAYQRIGIAYRRRFHALRKSLSLNRDLRLLLQVLGAVRAAAETAAQEPELAKGGRKRDIASRELVLLAVLAYHELVGRLPKLTRDSRFEAVVAAALAAAGLPRQDLYPYIAQVVHDCAEDDLSGSLIQEP